MVGFQEDDDSVLGTVFAGISMAICTAIAWPFTSDKALAITAGFFGGIVLMLAGSILKRKVLVRLIDSM